MSEKLVAVIIPCFNEEKFLPALMENLIAQTFPKDRLDIIFADGNSTDKSREILEQYTKENSQIRWIDNPGKYVPHGLNRAIQSTQAEIIIRMDAHSIYPANYISELVNHLERLNADNVGGMWITQPGNNSVQAEAIALATSHPLGIGNAAYKLGVESTRQVDTVPYGCFHREIFDRIGFFDEDMLRNQDDEFNGRIIKNGGNIYIVPTIKIKYFARATLSKMCSMYYQYGLYKPLVNIKLGSPATLRQFAPPVLVLLILTLGGLTLWVPFFKYSFILFISAYLLPIILISIQLSRKRNLLLLLPLIVAFPAIHLSYGIGYIFGFFKFVVFRLHKKTNQKIQSSR
jgi:glycosyltransferase involved in cell wall biosynthesis